MGAGGVGQSRNSRRIPRLFVLVGGGSGGGDGGPE